jgi:hypothetical protein
MFEHMEIRCPKLGGQVTFAYCLKEAGELPCARIIHCWQPYFPVEDFIRKHLTPEEWERCFHQKPKDKISTLLELIETAKSQKQRVK